MNQLEFVHSGDCGLVASVCGGGCLATVSTAEVAVEIRRDEMLDLRR